MLLAQALVCKHLGRGEWLGGEQGSSHPSLSHYSCHDHSLCSDEGKTMICMLRKEW